MQSGVPPIPRRPIDNQEDAMELLKIAAAFAVVFLLLNMKFPLVLGMLGGTGLLLVLFGISPMDFGTVALDSVTSWSTLEVVLALYIINVLQGILERRKRLELAQQAMNRLLKDQRLNTALASIFIGMMPAPSAVTICGQMMDEMAGDHLTKSEKACCASYYRHITEGVLPTYPTVIIVCSLSGVSASSFVLAMLPMVAILIALGFLYYLRKVPKSSQEPQNAGFSPVQSLRQLLSSLWTILAAILMIVLFQMPAWLAVSIVIVVAIFVERFKPMELADLFRRAFDWRVILGTFAVFVFKDTLMFTGIFERLPDYFSALPIPLFLTLALLFFFGTLVAGSNAVGTAFTPLAFQVMDGGVAQLVLLMGFAYSASQISPTHVCLPIASEYFGISLGALVRKILPLVLTYCVILVGYYLFLGLIL